MENDQDKIISFLRVTGPVLPAQVAKHINSNILLASAHLSELSSQGKIKISHLKIGGSPLYYLSEHKGKLQSFIHNLNSKDQQTLNLLKEKKILKERNLDLLTRVSLRNIKDFAVPLNITINKNKELFWKWYLLTDEHVSELIKPQLPSPKPEPKPPKKEEIKEKPETQTPKRSEASLTRLSKSDATEEETKEEPEKATEMKPKKPFFQKLKEKIKPKRREVPDKFFPQIESFFKERNIKIETKETLRKNAEMNFVLKVPSVVGKMTYFCKAKNKKRSDEKDISAAYMEARSKKLPLLFLYTKELSKKAQEMLDSGAFENLVVRKLG